MLATFAISFAAAYCASAMLLAAGMQGMALRFTASFVVGYGVFLLLLGGWLLRMPSLEAARLLDEADEEIQTRVPRNGTPKIRCGATHRLIWRKKSKFPMRPRPWPRFTSCRPQSEP
jgi:hypothetical protein